MSDLKTKEDYKQYKMELHQQMLSKQRVPYSIKRRMSESRIREFYNEALSRGYNCHVSVGGLDSIVLGYLIRKMGYTEEEYPYWVREDGAKMLGDYVMCAAELGSRPKGTILETSLGKAIVVDTGYFAYSNPTQIDLATSW